MKIIIACRTEAEIFFFSQINKLFDNKLFIFISFNQNTNKFLKNKNHEFYDIFKHANKTSRQIKNIDGKIFHEKNEFKLYDDKRLYKKYFFYYQSLSQIFIDIKKKNKNKKIICLQEIGGFLSHQSFYNFFRKKKIDVFQLEPSFFKDRFFLLKNTYNFERFKIKKKVQNKLIEKKIKFFETTKPIAYINLHKRRYRNSFDKLFDIINVKIFFKKIYQKYFLIRKFDYNYILSYTLKHIKMALNQSILKFFYEEKVPNKYIYFPLHVPNDISLTLRAKKYLNQYALLKKILKSLPKNYYLVIKEHPSFIGNYNLFNMLSLIFSSKIILLKPFINNYEIIKKSSLLLTINSKSGAEAIILRKKICSLSNSFYYYSRLNKVINNISKKEIIKLINKPNYITKKDVHKFINVLLNNSYKGEIYNLDKKNIFKFSQSLIFALKIKKNFYEK